jgi:hypothetical protein
MLFGFWHTHGSCVYQARSNIRQLPFDPHAVDDSSMLPPKLHHPMNYSQVYLLFLLTSSQVVQ